MVENRKYNDEEIKYVVSRIHAGWKHDVIAKAFKRDHGDYWAGRDFTKKQVAYIRSTYKPPPGAVKPYDGPVPEFSRSPTPQETPEPTPDASRKRKRVDSASNARPLSAQPASKRAADYRIAGSQVHGHGGLASTTLDPGALGRSLVSGMPNVALESDTNPESKDWFMQELLDIDLNVGEPLAGLDPGISKLETDMNWDDFNFDFENPELTGPVGNIGQDPEIPDWSDLFPDIPLQSIEIQRSATLEAPSPPGCLKNASGLSPAPQQQPEASLTHSQFPPGCTMAGAVAREDPVGVWYYDPHDTCHIALGHRHDMAGGVYFTSEIGVTQSLLAMSQKEGIGFLLGLAMGVEYLQNISERQPEALMQRAAQIARNNLPPELLSRANPTTPDRDTVRRLPEINRRLPPDQYYEPFQQRVVQYNMPSVQGGQGGRQGSTTRGGHHLGSGPPMKPL